MQRLWFLFCHTTGANLDRRLYVINFRFSFYLDYLSWLLLFERNFEGKHLLPYSKDNNPTVEDKYSYSEFILSPKCPLFGGYGILFVSKRPQQ